MAPEVFSSSTGDIENPVYYPKQAELFSVGCILSQLLAGIWPLDGVWDYTHANDEEGSAGTRGPLMALFWWQIHFAKNPCSYVTEKGVPITRASPIQDYTLSSHWTLCKLPPPRKARYAATALIRSLLAQEPNDRSCGNRRMTEEDGRMIKKEFEGGWLGSLEVVLSGC